MRTNLTRRIVRSMGAVSLGFLLSTTLFAQDSGDDVRQTVARVSYLNGAVSYARGDDPDNWQNADLNVPLTLGDRLFTAEGARAELQVHGGAAIRVSANTDLAAMNLTDDTKQFSQTLGTAAFHVRQLGQDEVFEVDTPNAAVTFDAIGDYRIDVDNDGNSRVAVRRGRAIVAAGGGQVTLNAGDEMDINGLDAPQYDIVGLAPQDGFDRWAQGREDRGSRSRSRQYVSEDVVGVADLDDYGKWQDIPEYGHVWAPVSVDAGWAPYRVGHWVWQDPWGWTWVSGEPWGWAPYHSGRWVTSSARWFWVPAAPRTRVEYSPAMVAFVGGGPGFSGGGDGFVGWFPLAPRDPFIPWWGRRANAPVSNVVYVNRSYVTVVNQRTFVSGVLVTRNVVTDRNVLRQVGSAPVVRGNLPFIPTQASLRFAVRAGLPAPPRPPSIANQRTVVARIAPPPAPPRFDAKVAIIRENRGAPVAADAAARIVQSRPGGPAAVTNVRPVASEAGRMTLVQGKGRENGNSRPAPTSGTAPAPAVPVAPIRGRDLATSSRPVERVERPQRGAPAGQAGQPGSGGQVGQGGQPAAPATGAAPVGRPADASRVPQPAAVENRPAPTPQRRIERAQQNEPKGTLEQQRATRPTPIPANQGQTGNSQPPAPERQKVQRQDQTDQPRQTDQQRQQNERMRAAPPTAVPQAGAPPNPQADQRRQDAERQRLERQQQQQKQPQPQPNDQQKQQQEQKRPDDAKQRAAAPPAPPSGQAQTERPADNRGRPQVQEEKKAPEKPKNDAKPEKKDDKKDDKDKKEEKKN